MVTNPAISSIIQQINATAITVGESELTTHYAFTTRTKPTGWTLSITLTTVFAINLQVYTTAPALMKANGTMDIAFSLRADHSIGAVLPTLATIKGIRG